jgi:hypothetical protein
MSKATARGHRKRGELGRREVTACGDGKSSPGVALGGQGLLLCAACANGCIDVRPYKMERRGWLGSHCECSIREQRVVDCGLAATVMRR